jgi:hypothetical protein
LGQIPVFTRLAILIYWRNFIYLREVVPAFTRGILIPAFIKLAIQIGTKNRFG